jgi:hypothetical protein
MDREQNAHITRSQDMADESTPSIKPADAPLYKAALKQYLAELNAMPTLEVERRLTFDPGTAARISEASAQKLVVFRAEIVQRFGEEAGKLVDALPGVARAARQADIDARAGATLGDVTAMHESVRKEHRLLLTDADALANRGLIESKRLEPARDVQGYTQILNSLLILISVLREHWAKIAAHTPLTEADLDRAEGVAAEMTTAIGARENGVNRAPAVELSARASTKMLRVHEELRRIMTFVRWYEDDVDAFIPSLWANRGRKRRSSGDDVDSDREIDGDDDGPSPATPSPNNGGAPFTE